MYTKKLKVFMLLKNHQRQVERNINDMNASSTAHFRPALEASIIKSSLSSFFEDRHWRQAMVRRKLNEHDPMPKRSKVKFEVSSSSSCVEEKQSCARSLVVEAVNISRPSSL